MQDRPGRSFGLNITNAQRTTPTPTIEVPPQKRRKLEGEFEDIEGSAQALEVLLRLAEAIEKQTTVLLQICKAVENQARTVHEHK